MPTRVDTPTKKGAVPHGWGKTRLRSQIMSEARESGHCYQEDAYPEIDPWSRQPHETLKAFRAFTVYRDLGAERSIESVRSILYPDSVGSMLYFWSRQWGWVRRARKWDDHLDATALDAQLDARTKMIFTHNELSRVMLTKAKERIELLDPRELSPADIVRWAEAGIKIERINAELATEITQVQANGTVDVQHGLDTEQLGGIASALRALVSGDDVYGVFPESVDPTGVDSTLPDAETINVPFTTEP